MNYFIIAMPFIGFFLFFILLKDKILSFFFPFNYLNIFILTKENQLIKKLTPKKNELSYRYLNGEYLLGNEVTYYFNKIPTYFFIEGNPNAVLLDRNISTQFSAQLLSKWQEVAIADLYKESGINNFLSNNMPIIMIVIGAIIIFLLWKNGQVPQITGVK